MDTLGVIPARYGSTRFPGKPLALIAGKPLLQHVIEGAKTAKLLTKILVATDDDRIAKLANTCGAEAVMTDSELPSGSDRVWAAVAKRNSSAVDIVVNIQGDEPLIEGAPLDALIEALRQRPQVPMATLGREMDLTSNLGREELSAQTTAKIVVDAQDRALYFSRFPIPFSRLTPENADGPMLLASKSCVLKHIGIYAYRPAFLREFCALPPTPLEQLEGLEQLRALSMGATIHVVRTRHESWGVDTPGDVGKIESLLKSSRFVV